MRSSQRRAASRGAALRPREREPRFASSAAWSAAASSASGVVPSAGKTAMPMLALSPLSPAVTPASESRTRAIRCSALACAGLRGEHAELVAAEAHDGVLRAHGVDERRGGVAQQLVAGVVAEAVVDGLEAVEVEREHREGSPWRVWRAIS